MEQHMRRMAVMAVFVLAVAAGSTVAESPPEAPATLESRLPDSIPAAGSISEAKAISVLERAGYSNVYGMALGKDGTWRGKATRAGHTVVVAVDDGGAITSP
jgi:hypothetical protein